MTQHRQTCIRDDKKLEVSNAAKSSIILRL